MAKPDWGVKRECQGCGARFYDLKRDPIVCPKCETVYAVEVAKPKPPPPEKKVEVKPKPKPAPAPAAKAPGDEVADLVDVDIAVEDDEEEDEESFVEDASELEEDTDASLGIEPIKPEDP